MTNRTHEVSRRDFCRFGLSRLTQGVLIPHHYMHVHHTSCWGHRYRFRIGASAVFFARKSYFHMHQIIIRWALRRDWALRRAGDSLAGSTQLRSSSHEDSSATKQSRAIPLSMVRVHCNSITTVANDLFRW